MSKFLQNKWFIRVISFFIALMLYTVVSADQPPGSGKSPSLGGDKNEPKEMENVNLVAYYDDDQYVISDMPETVSVQLDGPESSMTKASVSNNHEVFIDLSDKGVGTYSAPVQTRGFPDDLTVQTTPAKVGVTLQKKVTKTFPVQINLINKDQIADGYVPGTPTTDPEEVTITAGQKTMERIAFVEGFVDVKDASDAMEQKVSLNIYNKKGNEVDTNVTPSKVDVKVPMTKHSKQVPIHVNQQGDLPDNLNLASFELQSDKATIVGPEEKLADINAVDTSLRLDNIHEDTTVTLDVAKPDGVNKITPEKVKVKVKVTDKPTKVMNDIPVNVINVPDDLDASFAVSKQQKADITLTGAKKAINDIDKSDIDAFIDADGLSTGTHTAPIKTQQLKNVTVTPEMDKATIEITK